MNRCLQIILSALVALPLTSCDPIEGLGVRASEAPDFSEAPIQTNRTSYRLHTTSDAHEVTIGLTYRNPTDGPVYLPTCHRVNPPVLQKRVGDEWITAYSPVVLQCLGEPVVIDAGADFDYTYEVWASRRPNTGPSFQIDDIPGTYRLIWNVLGTWSPNGPEPGLGEVLPEALRISNSFELTE